MALCLGERLMKLSKKLFFVPAVALAFGLVSCGDNTYNANDTISSPEVYVGTDASGVNFIKVNQVNDAGSYSIYRRPEGQDSWDYVDNVRSVADSQWYFEADKTYQYKVVANAAANRGNLKSAETVKNVKTEKVFAANTPLAAEAISVALKEGFTNTAVLSIKTNPASTYKYYVVKDVSLGAEAAISGVSESDRFKGIDCAYVKGGKIVAGEYRNEVTLDNNITEDTDYYVVVKETAVSALKPATNYVISAKVTGTPNAVTVSNQKAERLNASTVAVTFQVPAKSAAATYKIYRKAKVDGVYTDYVELGAPATYNVKDYTATPVAEPTTADPVYYRYNDTTAEAPVNTKKVTAYTYAIVTTVAGKQSKVETSELDVTETSGNTATATPGPADFTSKIARVEPKSTATTTSADGNTSVTGGNTAKITVIVNNGTTSNTLYYAKFATKAAADKATAADFTEKLTLSNKSAGSTVSTSVTTQDGVTISTSGEVTDSYTAEINLEDGKVVTTKIAATATVGVTNTTKDTKYLGNYYVFRLVSVKDGKEVVSTTKTYYLTKEVTENIPTTGTGTSETVYDLTTADIAE